jgi:hypothetical protein
MGKMIFYLFCLLLLSVPSKATAQSDTFAIKIFKEGQAKFLQNLKGISKDSAIVLPLARFFESEVNKIYNTLLSDAALPVPEKEKAIRSLVYFINELGRNIKERQFDMYDIPGALESYKKLLAALIKHQPLKEIVSQAGPYRTQVLATTFSQYQEHALLDDIAVYKRVAASPEFILQFLENKPGFAYTDSLLLIAAAHDPVKLIAYLNNGKAGIQSKIFNSNNIYLKQIVSISLDKNVEELLPFVPSIAHGKLLPEDIVAKRANVVEYFQLLVNTLMESINGNDSNSVFLEPLRDAIKQKSLAFFVNPVNDLHSAADPVRFASVKELRPEDLYYIITSCEEELYTSSYLGLYKRLLAYYQSSDSVFNAVGYDNFGVFMRLAANYNVLTDFLHKMPVDKAEGLVKMFVGGIDANPTTALERAMDIGDFFAGLGYAADINNLVQKELRANLARCVATRQYIGVRLYNILLQVFELAIYGGKSNRIWNTLGNYEILKRDVLKNKAGEIVQAVLFYGDDDGIMSFNNFLKLYTDKSKWEVSKNANWVSIRSLSDPSLIIYANMPLDAKEEMDLKAQDSLFIFLKEQSQEPAVLVHRGHSYHLDYTLKRISPSVKLAILGSCGGYNKAISIASISPDVQVIGSKKTGSKSINDPLIDVINETLLNRNDISWPAVWETLRARFSKDEFTLGLFKEYFPPSHNLSLFVLKLFLFYN